MKSPKYALGDTVYRGSYEREEHYITCPDCGGTRRILVTLHDGTTITVECGGCYPGGCEPSTGRIKQVTMNCRAKAHTVTGVNLRGDSVQYQLDADAAGNYSLADEHELYATREEALAAADLNRTAQEAEQNKRLMAKTKDAKSWAWNATYHRRQIKTLERELASHREKVQICEAQHEV